MVDSFNPRSIATISIYSSVIRCWRHITHVIAPFYFTARVTRPHSDVTRPHDDVTRVRITALIGFAISPNRGLKNGWRHDLTSRTYDVTIVWRHTFACDDDPCRVAHSSWVFAPVDISWITFLPALNWSYIIFHLPQTSAFHNVSDATTANKTGSTTHG